MGLGWLGTWESAETRSICRETPAAAAKSGTALTAIARTHDQRESAHPIDVRCSALLPRTDAHTARCQLFAGHDGPHAVMFAHCGKRALRMWRSGGSMATAEAGPEALQRPWMFGYPVPAWYETEAAAESAS
jgi:hypothetical protein